MGIENNNYKFHYTELEDIYHIFFCLSDTTFSSMELSYGKKGRYVISCETMMSVLQTIETIDFCCKRSAYSDAYTLIRKYRDDLMQYLFVLNIIKGTHGLTDDETKLFSLNPESMLEMIKLDFEILVSGDRKTEAELAMEKWVYNELGNTENIGDRKKYFDASKYKSYLISQNEKIGYIFNEILLGKWKKEDRKLNNYVHTNGIKYLTDNYIYQEHKEDKDGELIKTMQNITDIFLSILALVDSSKLRSSDYLDALEMGSAPEQGSQYWVCPIIVEYMNDRFEKKLLDYIQANESHGMLFLGAYYGNDNGLL